MEQLDENYEGSDKKTSTLSDDANEVSALNRKHKHNTNKLFKVSLVILWVLSVVAIIVAILLFFYAFFVKETGLWAGLGNTIALVFGLVIGSPALLMLATGICGSRYKRGKSKGKLTACWIWSGISFVVYLSLVLWAFSSVSFDNSSFTLNERTLLPGSFVGVFLSLLTMAPITLFIIGCYLEKRNKNEKIFTMAVVIITGLTIFVPIIIPVVDGVGNVLRYGSFTRMEVNEENLLTLNEFNDELWNRGFLYDLPEGMSDLVVPEYILVEEQGYDYERNFSVGSGLNNRSDFKDFGDKKFPVYVYDSYVSLIQKSPQTAYYYNKGPEDWTISWFIYNINGQLYAAIGGESRLNDKSYGGTDLFETDKAMIVAEEDKIITYNRAGNYFAYGGCIEATWSTAQRSHIPRMSNQYNSGCAKIKVVDRLDADTLDKLAIELINE